MASSSLKFSHPVVGDLELSTGLDTASWGYSLNTTTYPTYGGEVVQILSCQVDDLNLSGTLRTYREMESLYTYMMKYMQIASQGRSGPRNPGQTSYNQEAMTFYYPERGWKFLIMPTSAPGFMMGTDVVAPTWQLQAHIMDHAGDVEDLQDLIISESEIQGRLGVTGDFSDSFGLQGKIGYDPDNPFSDPFTNVGPSFDTKTEMAAEAEKIGEAYAQIVQSYLNKAFDKLLPDASGPIKQAIKETKSSTKSATSQSQVKDSATGETADPETVQVVKAQKRKPK